MKNLNVQVGTEVTYTRRESRIFATVTKVTPTGRFTAGGYTFNPDGTVRGADTWAGPYRCEIATPEHHAAVDAKKAWQATRSEVRSLLTTAASRFDRAQGYEIPEAQMLLDALRAYEAATQERQATERAASEARMAEHNRRMENLSQIGR